jgi:sulfur transfer protein SufE
MREGALKQLQKIKVDSSVKETKQWKDKLKKLIQIAEL